MNRSPDHIFDEWLVLRAQDGEVEAMNELVRRWNRRLHAHARCLLNDDATSADAVQDAWHDIIRGIRKLTDPAAYRVWMYRIVSRRCTDQLRRKGRRRATSRHGRLESETTVDPLDPRPAPDSEVGRQEELHQLRKALALLPGELRALIHLRYREQFSLEAIALAMDCPAGTLKSRLHEARRQLRALLEPTKGKD